MKGLLIKDFKLMKGQKNFFIILIILSLGINFIVNDAWFITGYLIFFGSLFTLSTISFDEYDNGNSFLFTLPISRKEYVKEKYSFGLLLCCIFTVLALIFSATLILIKRLDLSFMDLVTGSLMVIPVALLAQAVMIPVQLKFGGEKGRMAMLGIFGAAYAIGLFAVKLFRLLDIRVKFSFDRMMEQYTEIAILAFFVLASCVLFLSYRISVSILNNKEF